jgi:hypothetical protein
MDNTSHSHNHDAHAHTHSNSPASLSSSVPPYSHSNSSDIRGTNSRHLNGNGGKPTFHGPFLKLGHNHHSVAKTLLTISQIPLPVICCHPLPLAIVSGMTIIFKPIIHRTMLLIFTITLIHIRMKVIATIYVVSSCM